MSEIFFPKLVNTTNTSIRTNQNKRLARGKTLQVKLTGRLLKGRTCSPSSPVDIKVSPTWFPSSKFWLVP